MAYEGDNMLVKDYIIKSTQANILEIVWRMDINDKVLVPTWPVVVLSRDIKFNNREPMECGIHYSWRYWVASRANIAIDNSTSINGNISK